MRLAPPFVLLDDARERGAAPARLYQKPVEVIEAVSFDEAATALERLRQARGQGLHAAGWLAYDAGTDGRTLWFGLFEGFEAIAPEDVEALLPDPAGAWCGAPEPLIQRADYEAALARVQALITAGDIYQANLTFQAGVRFAGSPLALYAGLRARARAGYGGIVHDGRAWLLSLSPELFFACQGGRLTARPMKGTAARCSDPASDRAAAEALAEDPKQRAENLMIVDLLRNDLSRVAAAGSVAVPALLAIESYPTVHQMTSTVIAALAPGRDPVDALAALFPCGSITGAPKLRAMEVIGAVEAAPRGVYTGAIGRIDANGDAAFNVAIRTLRISGEAATLGLGSGIVADSEPADEWRECLAKGRFVASTRRFDLIETMAFDPIEGIVLLPRHLARMSASADALGFRFDRHEARNELQAATFRLRTGAKLRLLLAPSGAMAVEVRPMPSTPAGPVDVGIAPLPVDPADFRLRHKTSDRAFYDSARDRADAFEVLFEVDGRLTEGSFTSLFVERDGRLLTPPLALGLLPGVLRAQLVDEGRAIEAALTRADLQAGFLIGNAVRGLLPARLIGV